jgi:hypothetical protein
VAGDALILACGSKLLYMVNTGHGRYYGGRPYNLFGPFGTMFR